MPELPEVESIRHQLEKFLVGHLIEKIQINNQRIFEGDPKEIEDTKFIKARRFGKVIVLDLSNNKSLMIHVKMTGQLLYRGPHLLNPQKISPKVLGGVPGRHTHVIFNLDNSGILYFNDLRRFGWIKVVDTQNVEKTGLVGKMGPEPFAGLNFENFEQAISNTKRPIKVVIMDQAKIGGIGNIYANDALWLAKISPSKPSSTLSVTEKHKLFDAIHEVLKTGIKFGGSSENSFVTPDGGEGEYQRHTLVYGKQGQICKHCNTEKIKKVMLGGRGTYYCPVCQL